MASIRPFRAFVSYCHKDKVFAAWLQRRLEAYRLPRRLAGQVTPLPGQAPGRIGPVFRDREDLPAASDLSAAVREAIAASSALVVVASPDAANSHWVAREIALFRELHPTAPILVALARGEPGESLPATVRGDRVEPLAADFRKEGDGRRLAFLKIVAGLADIPLDALVQRDTQRQLRRVTAVTLGAVTMVVIMGLLLVMALKAREEAERRRVAAEGMIEKLITKVRGELEGTGKVKVMAAVNTLAIDYYRSQGDLGALPDDSLERRARVLHSLGEDEERQGDVAKAFARFAEAHRATEMIVARRPRDAQAVYAHAQSEYWLGYAAQRQRNRAAARRYYNGYLVQAQTLARIAPDAAESFMEMSYSHGNLCDLGSGEAAELQEAIPHCREAVRFVREALLKTPGDAKTRKALANRLGWLADALVSSGNFGEALALRREENALMRRLLASDPDNVDLRTRINWPGIGLAKIDIAQGRHRQGVARLRNCLANLDGLSGELPEDKLILEQRLRVNLLIAEALKEIGDGGWRHFRDRAQALLDRAAEQRDTRSLDRFRIWLAKLQQGAGQ